VSWGSGFFYYHCRDCGKKFKYAVEDIPVFGARFGDCPDCGAPGTYEQDGPRIPEDLEYFEVEES